MYTPRKEYREGVAAGKGAYLLEQEQADMFTVSLGNIPAGLFLFIVQMIINLPQQFLV